ncbi:MAG TPA: CvpA family protein [Burkholderiales bacterium]|nr:CvpA family protein [Burkholderiales bacterium]
MTWVDYAALAVLGLSILIGLWRGLVREVLSLVGWVAALFLAAQFAPSVALWLPQDFITPLGRQLIAAVGIFVVISLIAGLIALLVAKAVHAVGLGLIDRSMGAIFGLGRGLLVLLVCTILIGLTGFVKSAVWRDAALSGPFETAALALRPYLPQAIAARMRYD